jgi:hypothetical protein
VPGSPPIPGTGSHVYASMFHLLSVSKPGVLVRK